MNWMVLCAVTGIAALLLCAAMAASGDPPAASPRSDPKPSEPPAPPAPTAPKSPVGFVKGYTWGWTGRRGTWAGDRASQSMKRLAATGAEWTAVAFLGHMPAHNVPEIRWGEADPKMVTDDEIRRAVRLARENKLKVVLKPVIDPEDGKWRGQIRFKTADGKEDPAAWARWWKAYNAFLLHYAAIAQETRCELLCIGCEMITTEKFEAQWRALAARVREVYKGPLVYNANHGKVDQVRWWDAVDLIGVSAYYPVGTKTDSSVEAMAASWRPVRDKLERISRRYKRAVLFIEIGMRSARGCSRMPWDWKTRGLPYDGQEQARYYEAALKSFWDEPWFAGFCWWDWPAGLYRKEEAEGNRAFCIYGKPAEKVLRAWYAKPRK
jgi:hypothetical protein